MKSVVVEASTVAKAIETAWLKAEKPEEFFIRILQEHYTGFLGFGAKKAKVVLFFKNLQRSDSLFPSVLKQKEYESLFDNNHLKVPSQHNVVDHQLNKNVQLRHEKNKQDKKAVQQISIQKNQQRPSQEKRDQQDVVKQDLQKQGKAEQQQKQQSVQQHKNQQPLPVKNRQQHPVQKSEQVAIKKNENKTTQKEVVEIQKNSQEIKTQHATNIEPKKKIQQPKKEQVVKPHQENVQQVPKMRVEINLEKVDIVKKPLEETLEQKHDIAQDIARVLKKVQSQKIISNVSRVIDEKNQILIQKQEDLNLHATQEKIVTPPVVRRFKRRPLSTDTIASENQVSGIEKEPSFDGDKNKPE